MTQQSYLPPAGRLGSAAFSEPDFIASRQYPNRSEEWTVTIAGTAADGIYSFDMADLPDDIANITISFDRQSAEDDAAIATALRAEFDLNDDLRALFTITDDLAGELTIVQRLRGSSFQIINDTAPGGATLVSAESVAGARADLGLALGVLNTPTGLRLPTTGDTRFDGVTYRGATAITQLPVEGVSGGVFDAFRAGASPVPVLKVGSIWVEAAETVIVGDPVSIRIDGTGVAGGFNTTADANRIAVPGEYETGGAAGTLVAVRLNLPS